MRERHMRLSAGHGMKVHSEYCDARVGGAVCENYCKGKAGEHGGLLIGDVVVHRYLCAETSRP